MALRSSFIGLTGCLLLVAVARAVQAGAAGFSAAGECRVWFFDVGEGDAALVEAPDGARFLIDGGPDRSVLAKLGDARPPWSRRLDAVVLTRPSPARATGLLDVRARYPVGALYASDAAETNAPAQALASAPWRFVHAGDTFDVGEAHVEVLSPPAVPAGVRSQESGVGASAASQRPADSGAALSLVLRVTCGSARLLFTGDAPAAVERRLIASDPRADVLVVGAHGGLSSSDPSFLDAVHPAAAVVSADGSAGHPHPAVLERLAARGVRTWITARDGDVLLRAAGTWSLAPHPLPF